MQRWWKLPPHQAAKLPQKSTCKPRWALVCFLHSLLTPLSLSSSAPQNKAPLWSLHCCGARSPRPFPPSTGDLRPPGGFRPLTPTIQGVSSVLAIFSLRSLPLVIFNYSSVAPLLLVPSWPLLFIFSPTRELLCDVTSSFFHSHLNTTYIWMSQLCFFTFQFSPPLSSSLPRSVCCPLDSGSVWYASGPLPSPPLIKLIPIELLTCHPRDKGPCFIGACGSRCEAGLDVTWQEGGRGWRTRGCGSQEGEREEVICSWTISNMLISDWTACLLVWWGVFHCFLKVPAGQNWFWFTLGPKWTRIWIMIL